MQKETLFPLFFLLSYLFISASGRSVVGTLQQNFGDQIVLANVELFAGDWQTPPVKVIEPSGKSYAAVFEAVGNSISGRVTYQTPDKFAKVILEFNNTDSTNNYTATVSPSPWIGGLVNSTGTGDVTVFYWCHQMCFGSPVHWNEKEKQLCSQLVSNKIISKSHFSHRYGHHSSSVTEKKIVVNRR